MSSQSDPGWESMEPVPEVSPEARSVAERLSPDNRAVKAGTDLSREPDIEIGDEELVFDVSDTLMAAECYLAHPVCRQIVDRYRDDDAEQSVWETLSGRDEIQLQTGARGAGSPPLTTTWDWDHAMELARDRIPVMPEERTDEWQFVYQDGLHPTVWRLVHRPSGCESITSCRWELTDEETYRAGRGDFTYLIDISPEADRPFVTRPGTKAARKEMAGQTQWEFSGDGLPEGGVDPVPFPEREVLTVAEIRTAYLNDDITLDEFEELVGEADDFEEAEVVSEGESEKSGLLQRVFGRF